MVAPRGLTEPFTVAEKAATLVAELVATTGAGVGVVTGVGVDVAVGIGVGEALATTTVPTIWQHPPCGTQ